MISTQTKEIQALVDDIRDGRLLLPELQRQFIWKSTQVRDLFDSLYHQYPSGQILVWETDELPFSHTVNLADVQSDQKHPQLLLDGQQRLTSLSAIMLNKELIVRGSKRPIDIVFNIYTEKFEVAGPRQNFEAGWISLTKLFTKGVLSIIQDLKLNINDKDTQNIFDRLSRLENIKTYKYQVNILEKLNYDEVTHIFVRINSGGTKLSSADLALAQLSSRWRGITQEIHDYQWDIWKLGSHLWLSSSILVRALSAIVSGQTRLSQFFKGERQNLDVGQLQEAWEKMKVSLKLAVQFLMSNCQMNRLDLLPTHYVLIPLMMYFYRYGENINPKQIRDLQRWVYLALIWTRYSFSPETAVDQDINAIQTADPITGLVQNIEDMVGKKRLVTERELQDQRRNSPFMIMTYVLARRAKAQDWFTGVEIDGHQNLEFHHVFPKDVLKEKYDLKVDTRKVDQVANLVFLTKKANLKISSQPPSEYLKIIDNSRLKAQSVPSDLSLWKLESFESFTLERRRILAENINSLLRSLAEDHEIWVISDKDNIESRIDGLEQRLRRLIFFRLYASRAENAFDLFPSEVRKYVEARITDHLKEYPFNSDKMVSLEEKLNFCQFSDYPKVIRSNWSLFKDDFGDIDIFSKHTNELIDVRNAYKHNREIHKSKLASGEAGLLWLEDCLRASKIDEEWAVDTGIEKQENNENEGNGEQLAVDHENE